MGKYHIVVYAICKNEAGFADRWMDSMSEADQVVVLDTGSTDGTVERLRRRGAEVTVEQISPWRFDTARNRSLSLVPEEADLCVCTDLDEVFCPGWRAALEQNWSPEFQQVRYHYIWSFRPDGSDGVSFWGDKIHARHGFCWVNPVHEVLRCETGTAASVMIDGVRLEHHADQTKSRGQYLPLLELAVQENPLDDRNIHYLGREYMFYGRWEEAVATLKRHLALPTALWAEERCASMRYIARCLTELGRDGEAEQWLLRACGEAPGMREPWLDLAQFRYRREDWYGVIFAARRALEIRERSGTYLSEPEAWGEAPYDLMSVAFYYIGDYRCALAMGEEALKRCPQDRRLRDNLRLIRQKAGNLNDLEKMESFPGSLRANN